MGDFLLFRGAVRDLLHPKRLLAAAPLVLLPAFLALFWRLMARGEQWVPELVYNTLAGGLIFGFTLVILAAIFGTGVVAQELEGRTILYLLTRPIPRSRILLAKFLGAVAGISVTVWLSALLLALVAFGPLALTKSPLWRDLLILPVGALAYGALFVLVATLLNRPLIYGLFFAFGWESWVPNLPGAFQKISVMAYLRVLAPHGKPEGLRVPQGLQNDVEGLMAMLNPAQISASTAWWTLSVLILLCLGTALAVFSFREYAPREDAE